MSNNKQSSVDWLIKKLQNRQNGIFDGFPHLSLDKIYEQAKAMHKAEQENTWINSRIEDKGDDYIGKQKTFEEYYKETYGGNK